MKASLSSILEPTDDGIIEQLARKSIREGEERLLYAMLENAIDDYQKYAAASDKKGRELFQQAEEWFFETDSSSEFSFENLCDYLDLSAGYVRNGLIRWKAEKLCRSLPDKPQAQLSLQRARTEKPTVDKPQPATAVWRN